MEKLIYSDNCFICNELMGYFKSELTVVTSYSEKPIFKLIEQFAEIELGEELIYGTGICQNCLVKFNEYDEFISKAEKIQLDIIGLIENKVMLLEMSDNEEKQIKQESIEDDPIEYEPDDEIYYESEDIEGAIVSNQEEYEEEIIDPSDYNGQEDYQLEVVVDDSSIRYKPIKSEYIYSPTKSIKIEESGYKMISLDNNQRAFQCDICDKIFKDKTKLKLHREIHTDQRNVICQQCGKGFKTMNCLRNHKRTHLAERILYGCDQCEKKYTQKVQLKKHIEIVHMNRRDFNCTICGASFGTKSVLKMHMLSHSDVRSEECGICGFRVHTKAKLRRHMKSHTGIRDYECGICGKKFLYSYNVIAHVRNVHEKKRAFQHEEIEEDFDYNKYEVKEEYESINEDVKELIE
ncbi:unnamed protein product [Chironomus riparius]|uniref:C2H2-type domain-containing protein n=1 Tax=Chironomus riparius TaxID=315576 RepID=A0A9N9RW30_9DIPT|nr:unnamed protein product [Chironomus riparius]